MVVLRKHLTTTRVLLRDKLDYDHNVDGLVECLKMALLYYEIHVKMQSVMFMTVPRTCKFLRVTINFRTCAVVGIYRITVSTYRGRYLPTRI